MAEFDRSIDYKYLASKIARVIGKYPIELQIVWLVEILMYITYVNNVDTSKLVKKHRDKDCDVMYLDDLVTLLGNVIGKHKAINLCINFRNDYVHKGPITAKEDLKPLEDMKDDIEMLAEYAGITQLNWNKRLCVLNSN